MTNSEFSIEFDVMYNNITSNQAPGLTEYEKSVFLTQAQEGFVMDLYSGTTGKSFEQTEEVLEYLKNIVIQKTFTSESHGVKFSKDSVTFDISSLTDLWYIIAEKATIKDDSLKCNDDSTREVDVFPVSHDTYFRTKNSPFRGPNERRVIKLDYKNEVEIISKYPVIEYTLRYIKRPAPIILENLDGFTINGISSESSCELIDSLHRPILIKAVTLAKAVWATQ